MTTPNADLAEQIARALALADDYDGCFERLDGTDPEGLMSTDEEDAQWWRKRAAAVLPIVDAAVKRGQAEAWAKAAEAQAEYDYLAERGRVGGALDPCDYNPYEETPDEQ